MAVLLFVAVACGSGAEKRTRALDDAAARRLIGAWDVTLWLDRPVSMAATSQPLPVRVSGTMAFVENHYDQPSFPELEAPTHSGVYDVNLSVFGVPPHDDGGATVIARAARNTVGGQRDSVFIVMNPGQRTALLLRGTFERDSVVGAWTSESLVGGGGRFVLVRRVGANRGT
ncbi:MAG: hypothetical protein ABJE10_02140 [bacterium]